MRVDLEPVPGGVLNIQRIAILAGHLWPTGKRSPDEQYGHGIFIKLVRASTPTTDPDLAADRGIYGTPAVGFRQLDDQGHTVLSTLSLDFGESVAAERLWKRLSIYSTPYEKLGPPSSRGG